MLRMKFSAKSRTKTWNRRRYKKTVVAVILVVVCCLLMRCCWGHCFHCRCCRNVFLHTKKSSTESTNTSSLQKPGSNRRKQAVGKKTQPTSQTYNTPTHPAHPSLLPRPGLLPVAPNTIPELSHYHSTFFSLVSRSRSGSKKKRKK